VGLSCGHYHTLALDDQGHPWAWGCNESGQCGVQGDTERLVLLPEKISGLEKVEGITIKVVGGGVHSMLLTDLGHVFCFGYNGYSQLGWQADPETPACEDPYPHPAKVGFLDDKNIVDIAAGAATSFALSKSGGMWIWGGGFGSRLGVETEGDAGTPIQIPALQEGMPIKQMAGGRKWGSLVVGRRWEWSTGERKTIRSADETRPIEESTRTGRTEERVEVGKHRQDFCGLRPFYGDQRERCTLLLGLQLSRTVGSGRHSRQVFFRISSRCWMASAYPTWRAEVRTR